MKKKKRKERKEESRRTCFPGVIVRSSACAKTMRCGPYSWATQESTSEKSKISISIGHIYRNSGVD